MSHHHDHLSGDSEYKCCDPRIRHRPGIGTLIIGLAILLLGIILTLDSINLINADDFLPFWPVLLIIAGLSHIMRPASSRSWGWGLLLIGAGIVILLDNMGYIRFDIWDLWPLVLVFVGLSILTRAFRRRREVTGDSSSSFSATAIMGGDVRRVTAADFRGGDATAIMGGCEIDLRGAGSGGGPAEIDCFAFWGGIEIWVPEEWEVQVSGAAILGGFEDKTRCPAGTASKVLVVRGTAIMGGVEVKS